MLLAQAGLKIACLHLIKRLAMSDAVALMRNSQYPRLMQALQCMQQRKQSACCLMLEVLENHTGRASEIMPC